MSEGGGHFSTDSSEAVEALLPLVFGWDLSSRHVGVLCQRLELTGQALASPVEAEEQGLSSCCTWWREETLGVGIAHHEPVPECKGKQIVCPDQEEQL